MAGIPGGSFVTGVLARVRSLWAGALRRSSVESEMLAKFPGPSLVSVIGMAVAIGAGAFGAIVAIYGDQPLSNRSIAIL